MSQKIDGTNWTSKRSLVIRGIRFEQEIEFNRTTFIHDDGSAVILTTHTTFSHATHNDPWAHLPKLRFRFLSYRRDTTDTYIPAKFFDTTGVAPF